MQPQPCTQATPCMPLCMLCMAAGMTGAVIVQNVGVAKYKKWAPGHLAR